MRVEYSSQVIGFVRSLAPEPRRALVRAIKQLPDGKGDIKALQAEFDGFWRLRVKGYRVIFRYHEKSVRCEFAEARGVVYQLLANELGNLENL